MRLSGARVITFVLRRCEGGGRLLRDVLLLLLLELLLLQELLLLLLLDNCLLLLFGRRELRMLEQLRLLLLLLLLRLCLGERIQLLRTVTVPCESQGHRVLARSWRAAHDARGELRWRDYGKCSEMPRRRGDVTYGV